MKTVSAPITPNQRIAILDALRGFAIFGILMVNMPLFSNPITSMLLGVGVIEGDSNLLGEFFIKLFFEGKFYVLFSMLFGYGFWLFINKTVEKGSIFTVYRRRVFSLLLFGISHILLLWAGDILFFYALFGFVILLFRNKSNKGLMKWVIGLILVPIIIPALGWVIVAIASLNSETQTAMQGVFEGSNQFLRQIYQKNFEVYSSGIFSEIVSVRLSEWKMLLPGLVVFYPTVLAMFMLGAWAARNNILKNFQEKIPLFRKLFWQGIIIGIPSTVLYTYAWSKAQMGVPNLWGFLNTSMNIISGISMCLLYVSSIVLLIYRGKLAFFSKYIAPVGRMALTNYLLHSIICTTLFLPYGFGLFGKIEIWQGILLTIAIYGLQIPFSNWWLKKFNYGPFEWLWRSLTYLKIQDFVKR
ncbi:MAG: DUF418 domain-containing protein [Bacteroidales bacterium]|nr:MAG: DUF418 domain-containing protein [Bacteroidales bacterium]